MEPHGKTGHRDPKKGIRQADLAKIIAGYGRVVPDFVAAVYQYSGQKFQGCDDAAAGSQPQGQGALTCRFIQFAQRKKTDPAQDEHTAVAPRAPQQFQSHVTHAAQVKQDGVFPEFQKNHLEKIISKKLKIFLDKREMVSYNNEADFGGSEIPWTMAA